MTAVKRRRRMAWRHLSGVWRSGDVAHQARGMLALKKASNEAWHGVGRRQWRRHQAWRVAAQACLNGRHLNGGWRIVSQQ